MLFKNGKLAVRKLEEKDKLLLAKWLSDPAVLEFYEGRDNPFDEDKINDVFFASQDEEVKCLVELEGEGIGYIQFYELDEDHKIEYGYLDETVYGIDQFIGEVEYWNKGYGTKLVSTMVEYLITHKKADIVVMDPQTRNERAIRCYEKCGFTKVKVLPDHELHEGEYQDCWLIEYHQ